MALALGAGSAVALPHGRAGDCFEEVRGRPVYKTVVETVPQAPLVTYKRTLAVYAKETRTVVVRPAHTVYETIPAVYRTVAQTRIVPGPVRQVPVPAVYRTVKEQRLIEPAHLEWRKSVSHRGYSDDGQQGVSATPTGEVLCRILVPARYAIDRRQVMISPATVRDVKARPRKVICYVKVLATPCRRVPHTVPAITKTVVVSRLVKPAGCEKVVTPRPARTVTRQVRVGKAAASWRRLSCGAGHNVPSGPPNPSAAPLAAPAPAPSPPPSGGAPDRPLSTPSPTRP
jgi:hypothetical protein